MHPWSDWNILCNSGLQQAWWRQYFKQRVNSCFWCLVISNVVYKHPPQIELPDGIKLIENPQHGRDCLNVCWAIEFDEFLNRYLQGCIITERLAKCSSATGSPHHPCQVIFIQLPMGIIVLQMWGIPFHSGNKEKKNIKNWQSVSNININNVLMSALHISFRGNKKVFTFCVLISFYFFTVCFSQWIRQVACLRL